MSDQNREKRQFDEYDGELDLTNMIPQSSTQQQQYHQNLQKQNLSSSSSRVDNIVPQEYQSIFPFKYFNCVQMKALPNLLNSTSNIVIASPTASGKTVCMELSLIQLLQSKAHGKVVYIAPNKALCQERYDDWKEKFESRHGLICELLTGDSERKGLDLKIKKCRLIFTTPEKFDSFTRRWHDKHALIGQAGLLLIDEVHMLNEERGGTLEAVIARMKIVQRSRHCSEKNWPIVSLRIVALSATLPNAIDIAKWIDAELVVFGDEARPVKLDKHVFAYPSKRNPYMFMNSLLPNIDRVICDMSDGCPTLIFCATRKDCERVAAHLAGLSNNSSTMSFVKSKSHQDDLRRFSESVQDNDILKRCLRKGICFHSAALSVTNRKIVERIFRTGKLAVCCTTTTLSQGVNLPARLVVIMSTLQWRGTKHGYVEYDRSTVLQMIGRAGRPQYVNVKN